MLFDIFRVALMRALIACLAIGICNNSVTTQNQAVMVNSSMCLQDSNYVPSAFNDTLYFLSGIKT